SASREDRNPLIVRRLQELGCDITYEEVKTLAGSATVGRPHIAQVLLRKGYVRSVSEAFDRYLADDGPAYVSRLLPPPEEAIGLIRQVGGIPVLAHPVYTARIQEPAGPLNRKIRGKYPTVRRRLQRPVFVPYRRIEQIRPDRHVDAVAALSVQVDHHPPSHGGSQFPPHRDRLVRQPLQANGILRVEQCVRRIDRRFEQVRRRRQITTLCPQALQQPFLLFWP